MRYGTGKREGGLVVDYADVLKQAVANERFNVGRDIIQEVIYILNSTQVESSKDYHRNDATDYRDKVLDQIRRLEFS